MERTKITKKEAQRLVSEFAATQLRHIERKQVVGSGGRLRTVHICEDHCWHGSYGQAVKCKNAHWKIAHTAGFKPDGT